MKKKVLILSVALTLLFSGIVVASSMYGEFEGYPIVKVKSNGVTLVEEGTPAVSWNGRVMVPIYMLRQLGADVSWDQQTQSVNVNLPVSSNSFNNGDLMTIKFYSRVQDMYQKLVSFGNTLSLLSERFRLTVTFIDRTNTYTDIQESNKAFNGVVDMYNIYLDHAALLKEEAPNYGVNLNKLDEIMNGFSKSIDYYREAYKAIENYYIDGGTNESYENYLTYTKLGFDTALNSGYSALLEYNYYYNLIQNY